MLQKDDINNLITQIEKFGRVHLYPIILDDSKGELLSALAKSKAKTVLEIGTCIGYSASLMLNAIDNLHITTVEINSEVAQIAKENFNNLGFSSQVEQIVDDAINVLPNLHTKFDFIFLDGPKAQYKTYLPFLINLLNIGGYIFADNVYFKGFVNLDEQAFIPRGIRSIVKNLRLFLQMVKNDDRLQVEVKNVGDGICIIKKLRD